MKPAENIQKLIKKLNVTPDPKRRQKTLNDALQALENTQNKTPAPTEPNIWRIIMKNRITKFTVAAGVIIAVLLGLNIISSPDAANIAWAEVNERIAQVDYVHFYWFKCRGGRLECHFEAWYDHGKMVIRRDNGGMNYDDGETFQMFDQNKKRVGKSPSNFAEGKTFFELITKGLLSDDNDQLSRQTPSSVGDDFLIYEFSPPSDDSDYMENIFITVGQNSHLPIQMKIYHKDSDYDLILFDYEAPEKPAEFFQLPSVESPNAQGKVLLDGEGVVVNIEGAPGIKQAIVRLYGKYDGPAEKFPLDYISSERLSPDFCRAVSERVCKTYQKKGGPTFRLEISFVTDEGYHSGINDIIVVWLDEAQQCGVGSSAGGFDEWPDGKFRNIRFSPLVKLADKEDVYIVEIRCWIKTE